MLSPATETSTNFVWTCIKVWRPLGLTDYNRCYIHAKWIQNFTHNKALSVFANGISYFRTLLKYVKEKKHFIQAAISIWKKYPWYRIGIYSHILTLFNGEGLKTFAFYSRAHLPLWDKEKKASQASFFSAMQHIVEKSMVCLRMVWVFNKHKKESLENSIMRDKSPRWRTVTL